MCPLACQGNLAIQRVEVHPDLNQFLNASWAFAYQHHHCFGIAEAGTGHHSIVPMLCRAVVLAHRCSNPTLGVPGVGLSEGALGEKQHRPMLACMVSGEETGDPTADDDVVKRLCGLHARSSFLP